MGNTEYLRSVAVPAQIIRPRQELNQRFIFKIGGGQEVGQTAEKLRRFIGHSKLARRIFNLQSICLI